MTFNWEVAGQRISLGSVLALAWPAVRLNKFLRIAHDQSLKAQGSKSTHLRTLRQRLAAAYASPQWNRIDSGLTLAGVVLGIVGSALKITMLLGR